VRAIVTTELDTGTPSPEPPHAAIASAASGHPIDVPSFVMTFICSFLGGQCTLPADAVDWSTAEETRTMSNPCSSLVSKRSQSTLAASAVLAVLLFGCKKDDQAGFSGGYQVGQTGAGAGGAPMGQAGSPATPAGGAPAAAGGAPAAGAAGGGLGAPPAGPVAQRLDATAAAAIRPVLDQLAKDQTQPGAKPVGETLVGNFGTGQTLETQVLLQPNKCYTVVATALPPVTDVNVQLVLMTPLPGMTPVLAVDQDSGPNAVLGKKATCYKWMFGNIPASAKVVVQVTGGSGLVAAQTYEK
jgi:hypothetical protein